MRQRFCPPDRTRCTAAQRDYLINLFPEEKIAGISRMVATTKAKLYGSGGTSGQTAKSRDASQSTSLTRRNIPAPYPIIDRFSWNPQKNGRWIRYSVVSNNARAGAVVQHLDLLRRHQACYTRGHYRMNCREHVIADSGGDVSRHFDAVLSLADAGIREARMADEQACRQPDRSNQVRRYATGISCHLGVYLSIC